MERELIRLWLEGAHVQGPEDLDVNDLADLLVGLRKTTKTLLEELGLQEPEGPLLSLAKIEPGSVEMGLSSPAPTAGVLQRKLLVPLAEGRVENIPPRTYQRLREIDKRLRNKGLRLYYARGNERAVVLDPSHPLPERKPLLLRSIVNYYGRVTDIGGKSPKVDIEDLGGRVHHVEASREIVKRLEELRALYEVVGLQVEVERVLEGGKWSTRPIRVKGVLPYKRKSAKQALAEVAAQLGHHWRDVDLDDYMRKLRG